MSKSQFSSELRAKIFQAFLSGETSAIALASKYNEIVAKYNISDSSVVRAWIKKYNANKKLRDYKPQKEVYMAEALRKTTKDERLEIVQYCLDHSRDYKGTVALYDVSYSQVYSWVRKFDDRGEEGLSDKRGGHKQDDELDELEQLRRENTWLKKQLKEEEMTVELLKKVKEYEGK